MCGINCILKFDDSRVDKSDLLCMNKMIIHRGPDFQDTFIDNTLGFGHCRLSIIDLSINANQPMASNDNRFVIVYNGEVYNFKALRSSLLKLGYKFKSKSDTEVVLNAYIAWGDKAVEKLNGMFAFLIWDKKKKELFIARDRYGIKPIYYSINNKRIIISSEIKSIKRFIKPSINEESLIEYFLFQNYLENKTMFSGIFLFEKGCTYKIINRKLVKKKYFNPFDSIFSIKKCKNSSLNNLMKESIGKQTISDVPISSYLSGGIDSSLITYYAAKSLKKLETFTCGFSLESNAPSNNDESDDANLISKRLKINNYSTKFAKHDIDKYLKETCNTIEEPRLGFSLPNFKIAKFVKKHNYKVILSGAGGDEMFGGYPWRYKAAFISSNKNEFIQNYFNLNFRFNYDHLDLLFSPIKKLVDTDYKIQGFYSFFDFLNVKSNKEDFIKSSLLFDINYFLEGYCIVEDKISMSQSLETRVPFLENDLSEYGMNLNVDEKLSFDQKNNVDGKLVLKKLAQKKIPKKIITKKKQGFSAPYEYYLNHRSKIIKKILNKKNNIYEYINYDYTIQRLNKSVRTNQDRSFLWSIISFNSFLEFNFSN